MKPNYAQTQIEWFRKLTESNLLDNCLILSLHFPIYETKSEIFDYDRYIFWCLGNREEKDGESHFSGKSENGGKNHNASLQLF
jgi:hypothetical protein